MSQGSLDFTGAATQTFHACHPEVAQRAAEGPMHFLFRHGTDHVLSRRAMPVRERHYYVYIMSNRSKTIYTGMTNSLERRVFQHKTGRNEGFTHHYKLDRLVYWEHFGNVLRAIAREKEIKGWLRIKKIQLIVSMNPTWADLSQELYPWMEEMVLQELKKPKSKMRNT